MTRKRASLAMAPAVVALALGLAGAPAARAALQLPSLFSDGMVLQRGESVPVWGTAKPGAKLTVAFRDRHAAAVVDAEGRWRVEIAPGAAGGPFVLAVTGDGDIQVKDVFVGDVWVCSGQSNMHMTRAFKPLAEAPEAIRLFTGVGSSRSISPGGQWRTSGHFSNFGQQFGKELYAHVEAPIGLIYAAVGGSGIQRWTTERVQAQTPRPGKETRDKRLTDNDCYEAWIRPLQPYAIRGVIWWQGEGNSYQPWHRYHYVNFVPLIEGWRRDWARARGDGAETAPADFAFLWVQLSSIGNSHAGGYVRDAQRRALALPRTGMAVSFDLTNGDLAPLENKRWAGALHPSFCYPEVARRLARAARAASYGEKDLLWSGPLLEGGTLPADQAVLTFTQVGEGLVVNGDRELGLFEAQEKAPADAHFADLGEFQPVSATLSSDRRAVVLDVKGLTPPLRIRYAWGAMPRGNLYNSADLPASPFMSDPIGP